MTALWAEEADCPSCGGPLSRDSVHNGLALLHGPWGCGSCGWSEYADVGYRDGGYYDALGGFTPMAGACARPRGSTPEAELGTLIRGVKSRPAEEDGR